MKKITITFLLLLVLATAGALVFVVFSPDFVPPTKLEDQTTSLAADNPVWDKSMDELAEYLVAQGVLPSAEYAPLSEGIATVARNYGGLELYWWDLEAMEEGSDEYNAYIGARDNGAIDLWGSGSLMTITALRGPFALNITTAYTGDTTKAEAAFKSFCSESGDQTEGGDKYADSDGNR